MPISIINVIFFLIWKSKQAYKLLIFENYNIHVYDILLPMTEFTLLTGDQAIFSTTV